MNRREFLKHSALLGMCSLVPQALFPRNASAAVNGSAKLLIVNFNGGIDWLSGLQPVSGSTADTLHTLRPTLFKDPGVLLPTGAGYSFHNGLPTLKSLWDASELTAILNVGTENMSRSHLDAEVALARGVPNRLIPQASGFIGRCGEAFGWGPLGAVSVTGLDKSFDGTSYAGVQARGLESFRFANDGTQNNSENKHRQNTLYSISQSWPNLSNIPAAEKVRESFELAFDNSDLVYNAVQSATFSQSYPNNWVGRTFKDADVILSAGLETNIVNLRLIGYDTHSNQENNLVSLFSQLDGAFSAFVANMKSKGVWNDLIVLFVSEFGRTIKENGSAGTDHGGANAVVLSGGRANSGIYGEITPSDLTSAGWLGTKYNMVEVLRRVLEGMNLDPNAVFAASEGPSLAGIL